MIGIAYMTRSPRRSRDIKGGLYMAIPDCSFHIAAAAMFA